MKKSTALVSILSLSTVFALTTLNVFAESNTTESGRVNILNTTGTGTARIEHDDRDERDGHNNEMRGDHMKLDHEQDSEGDDEGDEGEDDATEMSLHNHVSNIPDIKVAVTLPVVSSTTINTYADAVSILTQYQNAIKAITTSGTLADASSTLSVQERAILTKLMHKHNDDFSRLSARANELSAQIKDLTDVLSPLGSTTITSSFNLKNLILSQLKDFASAINDLKDLGDTSVDIIDQETN